MLDKIKIKFIRLNKKLGDFLFYLSNDIFPKIIERIRDFFTAKFELIDEESRIEDFLNTTKDRKVNKANTLYFTIIAVVLILGIWGFIAQIDRSVMAIGRVVPESKIKPIQSLFTGTIEKIHFEEGSYVLAGNPLFSIDAIEVIAEKDRAENTYFTSLARIARLKLEAGLVDEFVFDEELQEKRPDLIIREKQIYIINTKEKEIVEREVEMSQELFDQGAESEISLLRKKQNLLQRENLIMEELSKTEEIFENAKSSLPGLRIRADQAVIKSPSNGILTNVNYFTVGSVVEAGKVLAEVVPDDETLLVEVMVLPADAAFVQTDMEAYIALTAYDQSIYGRMKGKVEKISANTREGDRGDSYYLATLSANINEFSEKVQGPIQAGMEVQASIIGDKRTVMGYIFSPVTKLKSKAFREK